MTSPFALGLERNRANHRPLTPLSLLDRAADAFPEHVAVINGGERRSYAELRGRARRLASALDAMGIGKDDVVSALLFNTPAMLECHYGPAMIGAVLNAVNTRLNAAGIAFILDHAEAKVLIVDAELVPLAKEALARASGSPRVIGMPGHSPHTVSLVANTMPNICSSTTIRAKLPFDSLKQPQRAAL